MSRTQTVNVPRVLTGGTSARLRQNGAAIRSLREKDGWHQPEFARKVGMSQAALSNIEREKRSARPATIHRIAHALRVPVAAITRDYDEMEGPAALSAPLQERTTKVCHRGLDRANLPARITDEGERQ
jgi:transcriptional regulator with XRE-family HTH domain